MNEKIKVAIADDHLLFVEGIAALLSDSKEVEIVGKLYDGNQLLQFLETNIPDLVLLDLDMPNLDGLQTLKKIRIKYPNLKVVIISMHKEPAFVFPVLKAEASGYLLKETPKAELIYALQKVMQGTIYIGNDLKEIIENNQNYTKVSTKFSSRELEVLKYLSEGLTSNQIGEKLNISYHTIESHRKSMLKKMQMHNTAELVQFAIKNKFI